MKKFIRFVLLGSLLSASLGACVVRPAYGPRYGHVWVPAHRAWNGGWVPGHWR
jgi:hypothetical protein